MIEMLGLIIGDEKLSAAEERLSVTEEVLSVVDKS